MRQRSSEKFLQPLSRKNRFFLFMGLPPPRGTIYTNLLLPVSIVKFFLESVSRALYPIFSMGTAH
jgi:hypothetical protein